MLKRKIGIGCGVMITIVAQMATGLNLNENKYDVVQAQEVCSTVEDCEALINSAKSRISSAKAEEETARGQLTTVESDLAATLNRIDETEKAIMTLRDDIRDIESRITDHEIELAELDIQVEDLQEKIAQLMRFTQRMNNSNDLLEFLSESESLVVFIRRVRAINLLSASDAELMEELNTLVERQQVILASLQDEHKSLAAKQVQLELEMATLENYKVDLDQQKATLAKEIEQFENTQLSEEDAMNIAEAQKEILEQVPVPEVVVTTEDDNNDNGSSANLENKELGANDVERSNPENANTENKDTGSSNSGIAGNNNGGNSNLGSIGNNNSGNSSSGNSVANQMFIYPLPSGYVTCEWECYAGHNGIDLSSSNRSSPVLAAAAGVVITSGWHNAYGYYVIINHNINGQAYGTLYAHFAQAPMASVGQTVAQGDQIGIMGTTGNSTGIHLHFEIHPGGWRWGGAVNPRQYIQFPSSW